MPDEAKQGTGDTFLEIDLGEVGKIVIKDDGANDPDTPFELQDGDGGLIYGRTPSEFWDYREEFGDAAFEAELRDGLASAREGAIAKAPSTNFGAVGPFVCDGCHRTWPSKDNQTPEGSEDTCPECV